LIEKHSLGHKAVAECVLEPGCVNVPCFDPVIFEQLTGDLIKWAALHTHGAASSSGVDVHAWCRLYSSFGCASITLCMHELN